MMIEIENKKGYDIIYMDLELNQLDSWYQTQVTNLQLQANHMTAKMSVRQKSQNQTKIMNWMKDQIIHLANLRDKYLSNIKQKPQPVVESVVVEPIVEQVIESVVEQVIEPVVEQVIESVVEQVIEPIVESVVSVIEQVIEPVVEPIVEQVVEQVIEPVVEQVIEPVVEQVIEPVVEQVIESVVEPVVSVIEQVVESVVSVIEQVVESVVEPVVESVVEQVIEPVVESVVVSVVEPVVESVVEPVVEPDHEIETSRGMCPIYNTKKAVLVGINYVGTQNELRGCINDVHILRDILVSKFEYRLENIKLLLDSEATRENILSEFTNLVGTAKSGDHICFTFSGHGYFQSDLYNPDEKDGKDELIVSVDNRAIVDDEFKEILQRHLKKNVSLFALFDSCHSGSIFDLRYQYYNDDKVNDIDPHSIDTPGQVILLSGCKDSQTSLDAYIGNTFDGALTWAFAEAMTFSGGGTWSGILQRIRKVMADKKLEQIPQLSSGRYLAVLTELVAI